NRDDPNSPNAVLPWRISVVNPLPRVPVVSNVISSATVPMLEEKVPELDRWVSPVVVRNLAARGLMPRSGVLSSIGEEVLRSGGFPLNVSQPYQVELVSPRVEGTIRSVCVPMTKLAAGAGAAMAARARKVN